MKNKALPFISSTTLFLIVCLLLFNACITKPKPELLFGNWVLIAMIPDDGVLRKPAVSVTITLEKGEYQFSANNRYSGEYVADESGHIMFKPGSTTKNPRLPDEVQFIEILYNVNQYHFEPRELVMENKEKGILVKFERE